MKFKKQLQTELAEAVAEVSKSIEIAVVDAYRFVTVLTPRRSGRAAASWNLSARSIDMSTKPEGAYSLPDVPRLGWAFGDTLYISNNLPYIVPLDEGHSTQRPEGFSHLVLSRLQSNLDRLK